MLRSLTRQLQALSVSATRAAAPRPQVLQIPQATRALSTLSLPPFASPLLARRAVAATPKPLVPAVVTVQVRSMGYKLKTKSAVKKRFKVNCNGLVKRAQANKRHIATKKTRERIRRLGKPVFLEGKIRKNVLSLLNK